MCTVLQTVASPLGHSTVALPPRVSRGLSHLTTRADDETRTRDPHLGKVMRYQLRYIRMNFYLKSLFVTLVRDTGIEPVTSSVSGKRSPAELNALTRHTWRISRADDETRTRDPHLGKVMRYQLRYIRMHY